METIAIYHPQLNQLFLSIDKDRILVQVNKNNILSNYHHPNFAETGTSDQRRMDFDSGIKRRIYQMKGDGFDMKKKTFETESPLKAIYEAMNYFSFQCNIPSDSGLQKFQIH